jgi:adenosylcobinamide kinase/adenosylcobinamide-phosphate guanylyltransferase
MIRPAGPARSFVIGGMASGKSRFAVDLAREIGGPTTAFVATGQLGDPEFEARILRHKAARPATWLTIEGQADLAAAVADVEAERLVLIDSLGTWVGSLLVGGRTAGEVWPALEDSIRARRSGVIVVSEEVGLAPVPLTPLGRTFVDDLGWLNQQMAAVADDLWLVVAGIGRRWNA